jgi:hypothetical protein
MLHYFFYSQTKFSQVCAQGERFRGRPRDPSQSCLSLLSDEDRVFLTHLEEEMWREVTRFDQTFHEQRFAADFFEFGRSGRIFTRASDHSHRLIANPRSAPLPNLAILLLDKNTAQVCYNSQVECYGNIEYASRSSIWSSAESGWVMRFHQGTPLREGNHSPKLRLPSLRYLHQSRSQNLVSEMEQIGFAGCWLKC